MSAFGASSTVRMPELGSQGPFLRIASRIPNTGSRLRSLGTD